MDGGEVAIANNCVLDALHPMKSPRGYDQRSDRTMCGLYSTHVHPQPHHAQYYHHRGQFQYANYTQSASHLAHSNRHVPNHNYHARHYRPNAGAHAHHVHQSQSYNGRRFTKHHGHHGNHAGETGFNGPFPGKMHMRDRRPPCGQFFTKGMCSYGAKCKFSHDTSSPGNFHSRSSSMSSTPTKATTSFRQYSQTDNPRSFVKRTNSTSSSPTTKPRLSRSASHDLHSEFPSLPQSGRGRRSMSTCSQSSDGSMHSIDKTNTSSSFEGQELLFKDALMKQCSASERAGDHGPASSEKESFDNKKELNRSPTCSSEMISQLRQSQWGRSHSQNQNRPRYWRNVDCRSDESQSWYYCDQNFLYRSSYMYNNFGAFQYHSAESGYPSDQVLLHGRFNTINYPEQGADNAAANAVFERICSEAEKFMEDLDIRLAEMEIPQRTAVSTLKEVVANLWSDVIVEIYGSNYTRLCLPMSDVDCVILSKTASSDTPQSALRRVADAIESECAVKRVDLLDGAKIPVLKVVYSGEENHEIMLDITCAHSFGHSGLDARNLISSYQAQMPALRPLVVILKSHIQHLGLNCSFTGGLSSYALVLLVIRFLQACGDRHQLMERTTDSNALADNASQIPNGSTNREFPHAQGMDEIKSSGSMTQERRFWYTFSRDGKVTWNANIASLLIFFLETYVSFDYRQFGISVENQGEFFPLPNDRVVTERGSVVTPHILDPLSPGRSISNCFRMHEVIQAWSVLYQKLLEGAPLEAAVYASANDSPKP